MGSIPAKGIMDTEEHMTQASQENTETNTPKDEGLGIMLLACVALIMLAMGLLAYANVI